MTLKFRDEKEKAQVLKSIEEFEGLEISISDLRGEVFICNEYDIDNLDYFCMTALSFED